MVEPAAANPIGLAILGGAIHAATHATKARVDGEPLEPLRMMLTVVLGALIGLLFAIGGYTPTAVEWPILLAAYTGFIAELEAALKLLSRGYVREARARFSDAADEGADATSRLAYDNRGRLIGGFLSMGTLASGDDDEGDDESNTTADTGPEPEPEEEPAPTATPGTGSGTTADSVPDPYPNVDVDDDAEEPGNVDRSADSSAGDGEDDGSLFNLTEWVVGTTAADDQRSAQPTTTDDGDDDPSDDGRGDVISDGP